MRRSLIELQNPTMLKVMLVLCMTINMIGCHRRVLLYELGTAADNAPTLPGRQWPCGDTVRNATVASYLGT